MRFKIFTAVAQFQTCVVTITWLLVWILVNYIDWRFLYHTRWVSPITTKCRFSTRTCCGLSQQRHEHQAPYDAFHVWFHFNVDRGFHCWHFFLFAFYGIWRIDFCRLKFLSAFGKSSISFLFAFTLEHFFCLSPHSHSLNLLPYFLFNFQSLL